MLKVEFNFDENTTKLPHIVVDSRAAPFAAKNSLS